MELNEWVLPVAHNRSLNLLYSLVGTDELWLYTTTYNTIHFKKAFLFSLESNNLLGITNISE